MQYLGIAKIFNGIDYVFCEVYTSGRQLYTQQGISEPKEIIVHNRKEERLEFKCISKE